MRILQVSKNFTGSKADLINCNPDELVLMVDVDRCIACGSCVLACQQEHGVPGKAEVLGALAVPVGGGGSQSWQVNLPSACRACDTPCEYYTEYNFWATCPGSKALAADSLLCDRCQDRLTKGFLPACATRCSMKCIYFGRAADVAFTLGEKRLREMGDIELGA